MKTKRVISILLSLCMLLSLTACVPSGLDETAGTSSVSATTVTEPPITTTVPGPKTLNLMEYETGIDNTVINDDTIITLLRQADAILQDYDAVAIEINSEDLYQFFAHLDMYKWRDFVDGITLEGFDTFTRAGVATIDTKSLTAESHERKRYIIMCTLLLWEYADCYLNLHKPPMEYIGYIFICTAFEESGYDSMFDLLYALGSKEYAREDVAYRICFFPNEHRMKLWPLPVYPGEETLNHYENLLKIAFPEE